MIKRLLILNGLAILGAVLFHATGWGYTALFWWTDRYLPVSVPNFDQIGSWQYYGMRLIEQLVSFSVPAFLMVSGYFVAFASGKSRPTVGWDVVGNRLKGLIPPFLLWTGVMILFRLLQGEIWSSKKLLATILIGRISPAYYYIPVLLQLYILSPLLVWLAKKNWKWLLAITGVLQAFVMFLRYIQVLRLEQPGLGGFMFLAQSWFFPAYIFWFTMGIAIAFHLAGFKETIRKLKWLLLGGAVILFIGGVVEWEFLLRNSGQRWIATSETLLDNLYIVCFILAFLAFDRVTPPRPALISQLGTRSFGIYLIHLLVMEITARIIYQIAPGMLGAMWFFIPVLFIAGVGVPVGMMEIMNHLPVRRYYEYVFG